MLKLFSSTNTVLLALHNLYDIICLMFCCHLLRRCIHKNTDLTVKCTVTTLQLKLIKLSMCLN